jgi:hypothetical protein
MLSVIVFMACSESNDSIIDVPATEDWEPLPFQTLSSDSLPPCLFYSGADIEIALLNDENYESIRRSFAPQGQYVDFEADGVQRSFRFPYSPLDTNNDNIIGPNELIIYVKRKPLYANIQGATIMVSANPIRVDGDSILIFATTPPYTVNKKIYYKEVFDVDSTTGEITFNTAPQQGSLVSICSMKRLYDSYRNRVCSMQYFDFTSRIILGKSITGSGCLKGLKRELFLDRSRKRIIYFWRKIEDDPSNGCPAVLVQFNDWITAQKQPDDYKIVFIEDTGD